jgi:hypothetical protein
LGELLVAEASDVSRRGHSGICGVTVIAEFRSRSRSQNQEIPR